MDTKEWKDLKNLLSSLLISSPLQLTIRALNNDFRNEVGHNIPYEKFGFRTLEQCLDNMTDTLQRNGNFVNVRVSSKAAHIDKLVSRQVVPSNRRSKTKFGASHKRNTRRHTLTNYERNTTLERSTSLKYIPPLIPAWGRLISPPRNFPQKPRISSPIRKSVPQQPRNGYTKNEISKTVISNVINSTENESQQAPMSKNVNKIGTSSPIRKSVPQQPHSGYTRNEISKTVISNVIDSTESESQQAPMSKNVNKICTSSPFRKSETHQNYDGYTTASTTEIPKHTTLKPAKSEPQLAPTNKVHKEELQEKPEEKARNDRYLLTSRVPLDVQKNLIDLISKFDNGIWCAKLPETYQRLYKKELDYTKYGFKNLILMCMELEKIFYCYRPHKSDFILYDRVKPLPDDFESHFMQPTDFKIKPTEIDVVIDMVPKPLYPLNVLQLFHVVPKQFTQCDIKPYDFLDVCVAEIYNPRQFYLILTKYLHQLDKLMDDMQVFYSKRESELKIPAQMVSKNLYCVTLYDEEYHRAKIIEVFPQQTTDEVKVFCFDYGSVNIVKSSELCYLHKRFAYLPQQAIEARLARIIPPNSDDEWPREGSLRLLDLTKDKDLIAHVFKVERVLQRLDVFLVDTSGENDIYMNDTLVNEGYALFEHQAPKVENKLRGKALIKALQQLHAKKQ